MSYPYLALRASLACNLVTITMALYGRDSTRGPLQESINWRSSRLITVPDFALTLGFLRNFLKLIAKNRGHFKWYLLASRAILFLSFWPRLVHNFWQFGLFSPKVSFTLTAWSAEPITFWVCLNFQKVTTNISKNVQIPKTEVLKLSNLTKCIHVLPFLKNINLSYITYIFTK